MSGSIKHRLTNGVVRESASTVSDVLMLTQAALWSQEADLYGASGEIDTVDVPRTFVERPTEGVCYAA
jgi:hypothetical protein